MKKQIFLILSLFMLVGCSSQYNIKVTSSNVTENIQIVIDKSLIDSEQGVPGVTESDDQITPFINGTQYPFFEDQSKTYQKEVTEDDDNYYIHLDYQFTSENYGESTALSGCFENFEYVNKKDYYEIKLSGSFYCLYSDSLEINVNTPNVVKENNASSVSGNTYTWIIDDSNVQNTDISIKILKKTKLEYYGLIIFSIVGVMIVIGFVLFIIKRISNRKDINEI